MPDPDPRKFLVLFDRPCPKTYLRIIWPSYLIPGVFMPLDSIQNTIQSQPSVNNIPTDVKKGILNFFLTELPSEKVAGFNQQDPAKTILPIILGRHESEKDNKLLHKWILRFLNISVPLEEQKKIIDSESLIMNFGAENALLLCGRGLQMISLMIKHAPQDKLEAYKEIQKLFKASLVNILKKSRTEDCKKLDLEELVFAPAKMNATFLRQLREDDETAKIERQKTIVAVAIGALLFLTGTAVYMYTRPPVVPPGSLIDQPIANGNSEGFGSTMTGLFSGLEQVDLKPVEESPVSGMFSGWQNSDESTSSAVSLEPVEKSGPSFFSTAIESISEALPSTITSPKNDHSETSGTSLSSRVVTIVSGVVSGGISGASSAVELCLYAPKIVAGVIFGIPGVVLLYLKCKKRKKDLPANGPKSPLVEGNLQPADAPISPVIKRSSSVDTQSSSIDTQTTPSLESQTGPLEISGTPKKLVPVKRALDFSSPMQPDQGDKKEQPEKKGSEGASEDATQRLGSDFPSLDDPEEFSFEDYRRRLTCPHLNEAQSRKWFKEKQDDLNRIIARANPSNSTIFKDIRANDSEGDQKDVGISSKDNGKEDFSDVELAILASFNKNSKNIVDKQWLVKILEEIPEDVEDIPSNLSNDEKNEQVRLYFLSQYYEQNKANWKKFFNKNENAKKLKEIISKRIKVDVPDAPPHIEPPPQLKVDKQNLLQIEPPNTDRSNLLVAIKTGLKLRKVEKNPVTPKVDEEDLVSVRDRAIENRRKRMQSTVRKQGRKDSEWNGET